MPPLRAGASLPTLLTLTRLFHAIPKRSDEWVLSAPSPIEPEDPPDSPAFWWKLGLSVVFVLSGGVFAGLTLALMGSDDLNLRVLATSSSNPKERKAASKVLKLLSRGRHWVLVVLLLSNVIVNESLPIFLDDVLGGGLYAVIVSTTMIVIFGEIIPQAVCVRYGLAIGGACAPMVWCFMILFSPIAWPTAKLLDYILGTDEGHTYKKAELKSFLQFHREGEEPLRDDEIGILNGVLSLNDKHAKEIMTPIKDCLTLSSDKVLDHEAIDQILLSGFSRIPIHEPGQKDNFIGMLLVKRLITYNPDDEWPVSKFSLLPLPEAKPDINCFQALDYFQTGRAHLLLISETPGQKGGAIGIVSLEDLIEEIIGEEIVDETDRYEDNHSKKMAKRSGPAAVMRGIIERRRVINAFSRRPSRSNTHDTTPTNPAQNTISLPPSGTGTNGNTQDGILIQIDNGNLVAEPVEFTGDTENSVQVDQSKQLTVGENPNIKTSQPQQPENLMDTIEEVSPISPSAEREEINVTVNVGDALSPKPQPQDGATLSPDPNGEDEGSGSGTVSGNVSEHEHEQGEANVNGGNNGGTTAQNKKKKKKGKKGKKDKTNDPSDTPSLPFESHQQFSLACLSFIEKYEDPPDSVEEKLGVGAWKRNRGWRWVEHRWVSNHGYMYRKLTRYVPFPSSPDTTSTLPPEEEEDEGEGLEDVLPDPSTNHPANQGREGAKLRKVDIEQYIVYSKTYGCPQFCFRAFDETGAPLSVPNLLSLNLLKPSSHHQRTDITDDTIPLSSDSPFPLLQSLKHPSTGELVLGIHPCKVSGAVGEILNAESGRRRGQKAQGGKGEDGAGDEDRRGGGWVDWLECWLMLTSDIIDLTYP
ncbi:hypothetical protein I302_107687 [Kwoniella bestiolae CBS 10118]|uniref:Hemolysin n=1 Tax=Kwoniella bestiolae CBS 10118 TaxID=1296100 RepID=A0A1B9FXV1_9TREE|nr:hemolysin [Kwoniella bestiolae CBS 10118]OCF23591.1 hemolysin [Kwoniella bestiolae CBS 10118]